ncbi:MAG: hypothetical protein HF314_12210 [Ignavibacteria bacterium]|jgi:hypothetical protein|nr:hypothetical protein [Ignavibacteria bacterium]MCU7503835.1 hypothetical protein [Ignavibacteria bacterium]MCU7515944.1 hypothetical protein [Ignavibacteria bacterium]
MKLANIVCIFLLVSLSINQDSFGQENKYSLSALIGTVAYGWPTEGGGWAKGTNYSLSGEYKLFESMDLALQADYSSFRFTEEYGGSIDIKNLRNRVYSFSGEIIPKLWVFNIVLGGGVSYQKADAVMYPSYVYEGKTIESHQLVKGEDNFRVHGVVGFGGDIKIIKEISLVLQTRFIIRSEYSLWFGETGLKYNF